MADITNCPKCGMPLTEEVCGVCGFVADNPPESRFIFNKYLTRYSRRTRYEVLWQRISKRGKRMTTRIGDVAQASDGWMIVAPQGWGHGQRFETREAAADWLLFARHGVR